MNARHAYRKILRTTRWGWALLSVCALSACQTAAPPMPVQAPPDPQLSYLNIAITVPLAVIATAAEREVPASAGVEPFGRAVDGGARAPACGIDAGYSISRGPLALTGAGNTLTTGMELSYWLKGRKQLPCPGDFTIASCGTDTEQPRTAKVSIDSAITLRPNLTAEFQSSPGAIVPGDRCILNPFGLDVTDEVIATFDGALKSKLANLDKRLSEAFHLRQRVEAAWAKMSEPAELRPGVWLVLNPEGIGIVPVAISNDALATGIQVRLRPAVTAGAKPKVKSNPLPDATIAAAADTFSMQIPVDVEQSFVQSRLDKALDLKGDGTKVTMGSYNIRVTDADVSARATQVVIKLAFKGDVNGTAFLNGTPSYNPDTRTLSFPDLDYTLDTDKVLLNSANWVAQSQIRQRLRDRFTIDMTQPIGNMKQALENVLNRRRGNLQLHGEVQNLNLVGVYRLPKGSIFTAYLAASGKIRAEVDPQ
jgi:hypothetical protein